MVTHNSKSIYLDISTMFFFKKKIANLAKVDPRLPVGSGPCAKWFKGEQCEFYPSFTIRQHFNPSCSDSKSSYCECTWFCWNNIDVIESLDSVLKRSAFHDCTTNLDSEGLKIYSK